MSMNPRHTTDKIKTDYRDYIASILSVKDAEITRLAHNAVQHTEFVKGPYLETTMPFVEGKSLKALADENKTDNYGSKLGELLFSIAGLSRFLKTDCERSLYDACDNFIARFQRLETVAEEKGIDIQKCCYEEPDGFLNAISNSEK